MLNTLCGGVFAKPSLGTPDLGRPRWRPVELDDRHLRSHGKVGDCEQSRRREERVTSPRTSALEATTYRSDFTTDI